MIMRKIKLFKSNQTVKSKVKWTVNRVNILLIILLFLKVYESLHFDSQRQLRP